MTHRLRSLSCLCFLLSLPACAPKAPEETGYTGKWVMNLGQKTFVVLTLEKKGNTFTGTLAHPTHFQTSNGVRFSQISSDVAFEAVEKASIENGHLHFVTRNTKDKDDVSEYDLTLNGETATLKIVDVPLGPWPLVRFHGPSAPPVSSDWDPRRGYSQDDSSVSNPEMQKIFEQDQEARKDYTQFLQNSDEINRQDSERRDQTRKLVSEGKLHTSEDFTRAAFIFQHGSTPDDYLFAHTLAIVAAAKGDEQALWIGTATLDRYLQAVGKPQIYGTQFKQKNDNTATQEPYNTALVDDALRRELGVPSLAEQEQQRQTWTEQFKAAAAAKTK
jgi:hypothetical protein